MLQVKVAYAEEVHLDGLGLEGGSEEGGKQHQGVLRGRKETTIWGKAVVGEGKLDKGVGGRLYDTRVERAREAFIYFLISALRASRGGEGLVEGLRLGHGCERPAY